MVVLGFFFITCSEWPRVFSSSWALWSQSCSLHFDDQNTHFSSAFLLPEVPSLLVPVCLQFDELLFICPIFIYFPPKRPIFLPHFHQHFCPSFQVPLITPLLIVKPKSSPKSNYSFFLTDSKLVTEVQPSIQLHNGHGQVFFSTVFV